MAKRYGKSLVDDFDLMMEISKTVPEVYPEVRSVLAEAEVKLSAIERDPALMFNGRARQERLTDLFRVTVARVMDARDRVVACYRKELEAEEAKLVPAAPAGADLIREAWIRVEDPLEREALYAEADDVTRAALATAPRIPVKRGRGGFTLEPMVRPEVVRREALRRIPGIAVRVAELERRISDATYAAGTVVELLKSRTGGFGSRG